MKRIIDRRRIKHRYGMWAQMSVKSLSYRPWGEVFSQGNMSCHGKGMNPRIGAACTIDWGGGAA